jgi:hypothetical protein
LVVFFRAQLPLEKVWDVLTGAPSADVIQVQLIKAELYDKLQGKKGKKQPYDHCFHGNDQGIRKEGSGRRIGKDFLGNERAIAEREFALVLVHLDLAAAL